MDEILKRDLISVTYQELLSKMYLFGCRFTNDVELVKDCIHDVFLLLCDMEDVTVIRDLKIYVFRSFKRKLLKELSRRSEKIFESSAVEPVEMSVEDHFIETEQYHQMKTYIERAFKSITYQQKRILTLYYLEQRGYREIFLTFFI